LPSDETLIDHIYEAAVVPEQWPDVLHRLSALVDGVGATLFAWDGQSAKWRATPGLLTEAMTVFDRDGWAARNTRATRSAALRHAGFVTDHDILTPEEMETDPFYKDFLRPHGVGWGAGSLIPVPSGEVLVLNLERTYGRGPVERAYVDLLDDLRPHLARAALLSARVGLERAKARVSALEEIGLPSAVVGMRGKVVASNPSLDRLDQQVVARSFGRIAFTNRSANALLDEALAQIRSAGGTVRSIVVPGIDEHPALVAHVVPIRRSAHDIFSMGEGLLIMTPMDKVRAPSASLLDGLFDLSPAEARVARSLTEGESVAEIALRTGVSGATVRSQVKAILHKTGLNRQTDLVGLLSSIGSRLPSSTED
jgi:DNA-binding CsgD family transcriptional regulator